MRDFVFSKKRTRCPVCGSSDGFARIEGYGHFNFGKCHSCGAFIAPPKDTPNLPPPKLKKPVKKEIKYVPKHDLQRSQALLGTNIFYKFLSQFRVPVEHLQKWNIGADRAGNTIFFYVDENDRICTAKRIRYKDDLHRDKSVNPMYVYPKSKGYDTDIIYGQHQFKDKVAPIILVESEKSAVVAEYAMPNRIWLATGGTNGLSRPKIERLREIVRPQTMITIFFDSDEPGRKKAETTREALSAYFPKVQILDKFKDRTDGYDIGDAFIDEFFDTNQQINALSKQDREKFEERAAIIEFDGNLPRYQAEQMALEEIQKGV